IKENGKHFLEVAFWYQQLKLRGARDNGFIVAFKDEVPEVPLETPSLPDNSLSAIRSRLEMLRKKQEESQKKYIKICQFKDKIEEHLKELQTKYDQAKVLGGIRDEDPLFAMMGFTPAKKVAKIEEDFSEDPVAVVVEDPDDDDEVPVQLHNPPIIKYFEPLIKLFNPPHYREFDPTVLVAPFLGVFFGFCLADAAYGLFLLIIGGVLAPKFKKNQTALYFMRLIQVLGFSTLVIGLMMGQFMGVQLFTHSWSQKFRSLMPLMAFSTDYNKFLLWALNFGVIQLIVGFIVKIFLAASRKNFQLILANIGWIGISVSFYRIIRIWPNWSRPDFLWPAVACSVLIFFFNSPHRSPLKRMMGGFGALYNIVGVGGDMVSYARIFGLGLSSGIIASIVNTLALDVFNTNPYFGWFFALLIFLFGHSFNFAMAVIGSLVHSARLNFLEYYDKFFEGGGKLYSPFKSRK
ncbi:MAG: hypothetical protein PF689_09935, partial [Deltaproteobacteria bacterium]|nr:hypothetical protein [Deltaproteobacteria bacterium]